MKTNFTARYAMSHYANEHWMIHGHSVIADHGKKSLNRRKALRRWRKSIMRKAERMLATLNTEENFK